MSEQLEIPQRPAFAELPLRKDGPRGNAWGLFGDKDALGLLNYITPDITRAAAAAEIVHGLRVATDLPLDFFKIPAFGRIPFSHQINQLIDHAVNDDVITLNTQSASQWDGLGHFGYQDHKRYYNGRTQNDVDQTNEFGIHVFAQNGGIATRGVLLDYKRWADRKGLSSPCFQTTKITSTELREIALSQNVSLREGDVLMIRSGYLAEYPNVSEEEHQKRAEQLSPSCIGLESSEETLRFLWESGVVAVAGDMPTLEAWPWQDEDFWLHEWLLAGWGCPIGELFDLEKLAAECERLQKWSFFFSSMPLNIPGGVASPANGLAIL